MTTEQTAVAVTPEQSTAAVEYSQTLAGLQELRARTEKVVYAVATVAGMEAARRDRRECVSLRTSLDKLRLQKNDDDHKRIKARNTAAKWLEAEIVAIEGPIDQQITAREQQVEADRQAKIEAERQRVAGIREAIDGMKRKCGNAISMTAAQVEEEIRALVDYDPVNTQAFFAEFHAEAVNAHAAALDFLRELHAKKVQQEEQAAQLRKDRGDLDRRTREQEQRDHEAKIEREARERKERDEREEAERLAKIERDAKERDEREQRQRDEADRMAKIEAEEKRQAEERERLAAQQRQQDEERQRIDAERARQAQAKRDEEERVAAANKKRADNERAEKERQAEEERRQAEAKTRADERAAMVKKLRRKTPLDALLMIGSIVDDGEYDDTAARDMIGKIVEANTPKETVKAAEAEQAQVRA